MAPSIATVYGTALLPGVSRNGRLYTADMIREAVDRAQPRIAAGNMLITPPNDKEREPPTQRTHHEAGDNSLELIGRMTALTFNESTGGADFVALLADTRAGEDILNLVDNSDGQPAFLRGVSIRGAWRGNVKRTVQDGRTVETADGLDLDGLDYTANPGVPGARVTRVVRTKPTSPKETAGERVLIYESVQEAVVDPTPADTTETTSEPAAEKSSCDGNCCESCGNRTAESVQEKGAPALKSGKPAAPQTKASSYADPGYQDDKMKRYALDSKAQAKSAWSYINQKDNASKYTPAQLKRVKERIVKALRKFGVQVDAKEHWLIDQATTVTEALTEYWDDVPAERQAGSFCISLCNGPVNITVSSYCVDPADLDLIGRAAMDGACKALAALDPDMDGDIDVPGADTEDTDNDMETTSLADSLAAVETAGRAGAQAVQELRTAAAETATETPATTPAADTTESKEESVVSDETTTAATEQPTAATAAADPAVVSPPAAVTLSADQFEQLLAAARGPQLVAAAAETAPAAAAPATETAPATDRAPATEVGESEEDRIARVVEARMTALRQQVISDVVQEFGPPARKGVQKPVTETDGVEFGAEGLPADWPQKPLAKYTDDERDQFLLGALADRFIPDRRAQD